MLRESFFQSRVSNHSKKNSTIRLDFMRSERSPIHLELSHKNLMQKIQSIGKRQKSANNNHESSYFVHKQFTNQENFEKKKSYLLKDQLAFNKDHKEHKNYKEIESNLTNQYMIDAKIKKYYPHHHKKSEQNHQDAIKSKDKIDILKKIENLREKEEVRLITSINKDIEDQKQDQFSIIDYLKQNEDEKLNKLFHNYVKIKTIDFLKQVRYCKNKMQKFMSVMIKLEKNTENKLKDNFRSILKKYRKINKIKSKLGKIIPKIIYNSKLTIFNQFKHPFLNTKGIYKFLSILESIIRKNKQQSFLQLLSANIQKSIVQTLPFDTYSNIHLSECMVSPYQLQITKIEFCNENQNNISKAFYENHAIKQFMFTKNKEYNRYEYQSFTRILSKNYKSDLMRVFFRFRVQLYKLQRNVPRERK